MYVKKQKTKKINCVCITIMIYFKQSFEILNEYF